MRRRARRIAFAAAASLASLAALASAQSLPPGHPPTGATGNPTVAAGPGRIVGQVLRPERPEAAAGLDVVLYALPEGDAPGLARTVTDADGAFRFENISNAPSTVYLVGVRAGPIPYGKRLTFPPDTTQVSVQIEISEPTADASRVESGDLLLRIDRGCSGLLVNEALELRNPTSHVIFVPEDERAQRRPLFRAVLPAEASGFSRPLGTLAESLVLSDGVVSFWGPLYPGSQEVEFAYQLPQAEGAQTVERGFPDGASRVLILSDPGGPQVTGPGLHPGEPRQRGERSYQVVEARDLAAGATLRFSVASAPAPPSPVLLERSEIWLELDDAALVANEQYELRVDGGQALESDSDAPLLCLPLPEDAEDLRFSPETLAMGPFADGAGVLGFRGPIPAGESELALRYQLRGDEQPLRFSRRFPRPLPLLSIFVADTGLRIETDRLHRRRSVRTEDRSYLYLEGFEIEPEETVEVDLTRLPAPRPLPRLASAGFALLAAGAALAFLTGPLRRPGGADDRETRAARLAAEREALYAAMHDLDDDFDTGKLSAEDRETLRSELRSRAVQLLREERESPAPERPEPPGCRACGEPPPPGARFCPACGAPLASAEAGRA